MAECLNEAARQFQLFLDNPLQKPDPNVREVIYKFGMSQLGNEANWNKLWNIYKTEADASEKLKLMLGLANTRVPWLLYR